jgi:hypothetical protein
MMHTMRLKCGGVTLLAIVLFSLPVSFAAAGNHGRVGGQIVAVGVAPFAENPSTVRDVSRSYRGTNDDELFSGLEGELWFGTVGFGGSYLGRFVDESAESGDAAQEWWYDWKSDLFVSYHLFRGGAFLDPFVRLGGGVAMRSDENDSVTNAGIYQYLGGGAQVSLGGLVIGCGLNYNILNQRLQPDSTSWEMYPTRRFEARVYGGVSFGR